MDAIEQARYAKEAARLANGGAGDGAAATVVLETTGKLRSATVKVAGSGYAVNDVLTVATGTGGTFKVTGVNGTGGVVSIEKTASGSGYASVDGAATTVAPSGGTGCTLTTVAEFAVDTITVDAGGTNYISAIPRFVDGGNIGYSDGVATIDTGAVDTITAPVGVKFTTVPTVSIVAGGPADATAYVNALKAYDLTLQNARVKLVMEDILITEVLTPEQATVIRVAIATL